MSFTTKQSLQKFQGIVFDYYSEHKRGALPWRKTKDPYKVLVSEVMLQQTQVDRVSPKYREFLKTYPTVRVLAHAPLGDVLMLWQGLGYNRRAKMLHLCAQKVVAEYKGTFPKTQKELEQLPGIGPYTAGAVMAFAYNKPVVMIETNIRTVFIHHFFNDQTDISDKELIRYIEPTIDCENPREWYWALMDYGSYLKKTHGNPNSRSKHYAKQSKFQGSDRQIRGAIVRALAKCERPLTRAQLLKTLSHFEDIRIDAQLEKLLSEGMIMEIRGKYLLPR